MGRLTRFERLKNSREFDAVYRRADTTWHTPYFVLFYRKTTHHRVGFVAGKKVGNAVRRNRAKRLLRAHFLETADSLRPGDYVWVAKAPILAEHYSKTHRAFLHALKRASALSATDRPLSKTSL